jgi:hypothetical protein
VILVNFLVGLILILSAMISLSIDKLSESFDTDLPTFATCTYVAHSCAPPHGSLAYFKVAATAQRTVSR